MRMGSAWMPGVGSAGMCVSFSNLIAGLAQGSTADVRCAGVGRLGGVCAAAGCERHPAKEGAGQARCQPAEDWRGRCAPACQSDPGPPNHAGSGVGHPYCRLLDHAYSSLHRCTERWHKQQRSGAWESRVFGLEWLMVVQGSLLYLAWKAM